VQPNEPLGSNYTLRESETSSRQIAELVPDPKLWDEIKANFDHELCRDPSYGGEIPGWYLQALTVVTIPEITIYYEVDHNAGIVELVEAWLV